MILERLTHFLRSNGRNSKMSSRMHLPTDIVGQSSTVTRRRHGGDHEIAVRLRTVVGQKLGR